MRFVFLYVIGMSTSSVFFFSLETTEDGTALQCVQELGKGVFFGGAVITERLYIDVKQGSKKYTKKLMHIV